MAINPDYERWAEALAIERQRVAEARSWVAERIAQLAIGGDMASVQRMQAIAARLDQLATKRTPS